MTPLVGVSGALEANNPVVVELEGLRLTGVQGSVAGDDELPGVLAHEFGAEHDEPSSWTLQAGSRRTDVLVVGGWHRSIWLPGKIARMHVRGRS